MTIRTVQWNIGGAHIRTAEDDPVKSESYVHEDISYVIKYLKNCSADIITLQETHADNLGSQATTISEQLGLPYFVNDAYDKSHIDTSQKLCQSIISRFPIEQHTFSLLYNPRYRRVMKTGIEWVSHDKGLSTAVVNLGESKMTIQTLHLIPFHIFDADLESEEGKKMRESIEILIAKEGKPYLLQGDFNYADVNELLPSIFSGELHELAKGAPTTPKNKIYDHVFFRGMKENSMPIIDIDVLTDHYPMIASFKLD